MVVDDSARGATSALPADVEEHLGRIVDRVVTEKPRDALGVVEILSRLVKDAAAEKRPPGSQEPTEKELAEISARADHANKLLTLDQDFYERGEDGVPTTAKPCVAIPDFMVDADMLSWAGIGFGELESYKVMCSMRNLATSEEVTSAGYKALRMWGKVLGTENDYYVVEAEREAQPDWDPEYEGEEMDSKAAMYSFYVYYVCNDLCGNWTKLPELRPRHIKVAREIKRLFTGSLSAPVITHPYFEGTEANLLRAQIGLITADTVLTVKGLYTFPGEEEPVHLTRPSADTLNAEFTWPLPAELLKPDSWVHAHAHVLASGMTFNEEPAEDPPEKDDAEAYGKYLANVAVQEMDPKRDLMRGIAVDKLSWATKQAGDTSLYSAAYGTHAEKPKGPWSTATTFVRSLSWPGAVCACRGTQITNLYVGYGLMTGAPDFYFRAPLDIQDEPDEATEVSEPQLTEEKLAEEDAEA